MTYNNSQFLRTLLRGNFKYIYLDIRSDRGIKHNENISCGLTNSLWNLVRIIFKIICLGLIE